MTTIQDILFGTATMVLVVAGRLLGMLECDE